MSPVPGNNRDDPGANRDEDELDVFSAAVPPVFIDGGSSSGSEAEEDDGYQGYHVLPQEPDTNDSDIDHGESDGAEEDATGNGDGVTQTANPLSVGDLEHVQGTSQPSYMQVPPITASEVTERAELWNSYHPAQDQPHIPMDQEQIDKIKTAMSGFSLPSSCTPEWAKFVPDEDWKAKLITQLHQPGVLPSVGATSPPYSNGVEESAESSQTVREQKEISCDSREESSSGSCHSIEAECTDSVSKPTDGTT